MNAIVQGRQDLQTWEARKPDNFFSADTNLQHVLQRYWGHPKYQTMVASLTEFGALCATIIDEAVRIEDGLLNHPQLERWSGIGEQLEHIEFHPNHDTVGRLVWRSGVLSMQGKPGNVMHQMALVYLLAHNSEAGHLCSLACTSGMVRALQTVGSPDIVAKFLPPLLNPDYDAKQHAAQFLTEVQGGSDVGANAVQAMSIGDGTWRISGEKWFCSNINAEQFLVTARPVDATPGTKGLGMFAVPRNRDDGSLNGFTIRRLKDKLGTRTLASAEVDFVDAVAYPIGPLEDGFKNAVSLVLNTSRLHNAIVCAGIMRRAYLEAAHYACVREAFGAPIASYPLVQEALADLYCETCAATASGFALAHLLDSIESGAALSGDRDTYRMLVNINKYITSIRGTETVHRAIEVLGGNGAIESFSVLPRLYRDMVVLESWEGTHNVLCLQVLRDMQRYRIHERFIRFVESQLSSVTAPEFQEQFHIVRQALHDTEQMVAHFSESSEKFAQAHSRRMVDRFASIAQAVLMLAELQWEKDHQIESLKSDAMVHFVNRHLRPEYDPLHDDDYLRRLERFATIA